MNSIIFLLVGLGKVILQAQDSCHHGIHYGPPFLHWTYIEEINLSICISKPIGLIVTRLLISILLLYPVFRGLLYIQ